MTSKLNNQFYFVSPLEVVKVTSENLQEAAEWCGGKVATVESRKVKGRMDSYVWVPTPKGTQISWAFPGMYITRRIIVTLKNELAYSFQVYRRDYFQKNYFETPSIAVDETWERAAKASARKTKKVAMKPTPPGVAERQAIEAETGDDDTIPAEAMAGELVQENRVKVRGHLMSVEDAQLPDVETTDVAGVPVAPGVIQDEVDEAQSLGEAVALVEQELGGEEITVEEAWKVLEGDLTPDKTIQEGSNEIPVEDLRVK